MTITAFFVTDDYLLFLEPDDVAESLASLWQRWFEENEDRLPNRYDSASVLIGEYIGDDDGNGEFIADGKAYKVIDNVVKYTK